MKKEILVGTKENFKSLPLHQKIVDFVMNLPVTFDLITREYNQTLYLRKIWDNEDYGGIEKDKIRIIVTPIDNVKGDTYTEYVCSTESISLEEYISFGLIEDELDTTNGDS